ncbi:MAG: sensor histidine kinase [Lachnospiraceae bacterium]|nr:sensor histidine kinase [Lachnospiraceae bacterium]
MKEDKLRILEELYEDSLQEKKTISDELQSNLNRIKEIDTYLKSIRESEECDFKVFSPRSAEILYKDKISESEIEKTKLENKNSNYYQKLEKIDKKISDLAFLIKDNKSIDKNMHFTILDIQERERIRISRELHDSSLQNLTHLIHSLELSSMFIDQDPIRAKLELASCSQNLKQIINEIRDTIFNLRPMSFDDLGFKNCIENFIDNLKKQYNNCEIIYDVDDIPIVSGDEKERELFTLYLVTIYRVIQEAMINSMKHSEADKLELSVKKKEQKLVVNIIDNGKGFPANDVINSKDSKHFGILIMQERVYLLNGKFDIISEPGCGTRIFISVPFI